MEFDRELCNHLGMRTGRILPYGHIGDRARLGTKVIISKEQRIRFSVNVKDFLKTIGGLSVESRDEKLRKFGEMRRAWTQWPPEIRIRACELHESNLEAQRIAIELAREYKRRVPMSTVYFWIKKGTKTYGEFASRFQRN